MIEKAPDVTVQNPVHLLPRNRDVQRIQRLMLTAPWSETIREPPKVLLVNLIENFDHGVLDDFIFQRRDPERPLPTIRFRDVHSSRWLRSVSAAVNPAVQIGEPTIQPGLILLPSDSVYPWSSFTLQGVKAVSEQCDCQMVKQGGELHLLPFPCCPAHTRQPLGHARLALCRVRAGLRSVLLDQRPSLLTLRRRFPAFVRMIHRYYSAVRLLEDVHVGRAAFAFAHRPATKDRCRHLRGLPVLVHGVSRRAWGLRLRRAAQQLALALLVVWPSAVVTASAPWLQIFEARYPAPLFPCLRFA